MITIQSRIDDKSTLITQEKENRKQLFDAIDDQKKQIKERLNQLYENRDQAQNSLYDSINIIETTQANLASQFIDEQPNIETISQFLSNDLEKIKKCKNAIIDKILLPTKSFTSQNITLQSKSIQDGFESFTDQLASENCLALSDTYREKLFSSVKKLDNQSKETSLFFNKTNTPPSPAQSTNSSDPSTTAKDNIQQKQHGLIRDLNKLLSEVKKQKDQLTVCSIPTINITGVKNKSLSNLFESFKTSNELKEIDWNEDSENNNTNLIKTLNKISSDLESTKKTCQIFSDEIKQIIQKTVSSFSSYIKFLSPLNGNIEELKEKIATAQKNESTFKSTELKIDTLIKSNTLFLDSQPLLRNIDNTITQLRNEINLLLDRKQKIKAGAEKQDEIFRNDIQSITQISGFENLKLLEKEHVELSCEGNSNKDIFTVIMPQGMKNQLVLSTYDPNILHKGNKHEVKETASSHEFDKHIHLQVPLQDVINAQASVLPSRFDQILLSDAKGNVFYKSSPRRNGRTKQLGRFQFEPFAYDFIGYQSLKEILKLDNIDSKITLPTGQKKSVDIEIQTADDDQSVKALSRTRIFKIGDSRFRAFIQPVNLPVVYCDGTGKEGDKQWYLIGVINEDRFQQSAVAAPPVFIGSAILLIVIIILVLPFLKVLLADQHTLISKRLRRLVIWSLSMCLMFIVLFLCLVCSHYYFHMQNEAVVKKLNIDLRQDFKSELSTKLNTFEYQKLLFSGINSISGDLEKCLKDLNHYSYRGADFAQKIYSPFYTFMVLNKEGIHAGLINSVKKIHTDKSSTLNSRLYFNNARNGNTWGLKGQSIDQNNLDDFNSGLPSSCKNWNRTTKDIDNVFIQRIISYIDGRHETIISAPLEGQKVAVMDVRFDSFFQPVLPLHFSFAVIESNTGRVLYHSSPERELVENFIDETDGDSALIAKLYHQKAGGLDLTYQHESIQAFVAPLLIDTNNQQVKWHLITYKTLDLDQNLILLTTLTAACFLLVIGTLVFILLELFIFWKQNKKVYTYQVGGQSSTKKDGFVEDLQTKQEKNTGIRVWLIIMALLMVSISLVSYCTVFTAFKQAELQYQNEYMEKEKSVAKTGYQKIYQILECTEISTQDCNFKPDHRETFAQKMVESVLKTYNTVSSFPKINIGFNSALKSVLPVISYSTGVFGEYIEKKTEKKTESQQLNIFFQIALGLIFLILFMLLSLSVIYAVISIINRIKKDLFDTVIQSHYYSNKTDIFSSGKKYTPKDRLVYAINKILLLITPEQMSGLISEARKQCRSPEKIVIIDNLDSLTLCHNSYPEGSVIFITDLASLLMHKESNAALLPLLEAFIAQQLHIIIASDIVPGYWLNVLEHGIEEDLSNDTGIIMQISRWSSVLEKFELRIVIEEHESTTRGSSSIINSAFSTFHKQWALSTYEEQSVLSSLASNDLVNRKNAHAIESLICRGLIVSDPHLSLQKYLRIKESAFIDFIKTDFHERNIDAWRHQGSHKAWSAVLPVILVILALMVLFLASTGTEALQYSLSVIAGLAAAIPAFSTIIGHLKK